MKVASRSTWTAPSVERAVAAAALDLGAFLAAFRSAVARTMPLCDRVLANCFVNASYDPSRNGTCPYEVWRFHELGFERENLKRRNVLSDPFVPRGRGSRG